MSSFHQLNHVPMQVPRPPQADWAWRVRRGSTIHSITGRMQGPRAVVALTIRRPTAMW